MKDVNWQSQDGSCSHMGNWCLRCNISYYDYSVFTGLRCTHPKKDGVDCNSFLDKDFNCTQSEQHIDACFQICSLDYRHDKRVKIAVFACTKPNTTPIKVLEHGQTMLNVFSNHGTETPIFDFGLIDNLKQTLLEYHSH